MATGQSHGPGTGGEIDGELETERVETGATLIRSEQLVAASAATSAGVNTVVAGEEPKEKELSAEDAGVLLVTLQERFERNRNLHPNLKWDDVSKALGRNLKALWSLHQMESTGGEPDVLVLDENETDFVFVDCSVDSPPGRRDVVFDASAERYSRAKFADEEFNGNAADRVAEWDVDFMDGKQYVALQKSLPVDIDTWSWLKTPADIRKDGTALAGYRVKDKGIANVQQASFRSATGGFRCALRVPKVSE